MRSKKLIKDGRDKIVGEVVEGKKVKELIRKVAEGKKEL